MVDVAQVKMFGKTVGAVSWNPQYGIARFEYDDDFVRSGIQPSPILMPTREGRIYSFGELNQETFKGLLECWQTHYQILTVVRCLTSGLP